jgi:hypothetical protein
VRVAHDLVSPIMSADQVRHGCHALLGLRNGLPAKKSSRASS